MRLKNKDRLEKKKKKQLFTSDVLNGGRVRARDESREKVDHDDTSVLSHQW